MGNLSEGFKKAKQQASQSLQKAKVQAGQTLQKVKLGAKNLSRPNNNPAEYSVGRQTMGSLGSKPTNVPNGKSLPLTQTFSNGINGPVTVLPLMVSFLSTLDRLAMPPT